MKQNINQLLKANKILNQNLDRTNEQAIYLLGENEYLKSVNARLEQENKELKAILEKLIKGAN